MKFKKYVKYFGIHSNRVRKAVKSRYKSKYGSDSDEYKDFIEKSALLKYLEGRKTELYRPYGYANSNKRILPLIGDKFNTKEYKRIVNDYNPQYRDEVSLRDYNSILDKEHSKFNLKLYNKYKRRNKLANNKLSEFRDGNRVITPMYLNAAEKSGIDVDESPYRNSSASYRNDDKGNIVGIELNINPKGSDFEAAHELQHISNTLNGYNMPDTYQESYNKFTNKDKVVKDRPYLVPNDILNYSHNVLEEELNANRARSMSPWIFTRGYMTDDLMKRSHDESSASQNTYNSRIGGYNPTSLRYNTDSKLENVIKNKVNSNINHN